MVALSARRPMSAWISLHGLTAVNASPVSISEFVLDVGWNSEAVCYRRLILSAAWPIDVMSALHLCKVARAGPGKHLFAIKRQHRAQVPQNQLPSGGGVSIR